VTGITPFSATTGGTVISDGGALVTSRGVCWSTSANPTTAGNHTSDGEGTGSFVSTLADLSWNTLYYVRAYATNSTGTVYGNEVSFSTLDCGASFIVNHVSGTVAPVTKTVTYGTVTNIPGEPSKCWITSNLGADHQATAVDDATEASAGWYWQFEHRQGYKHDGTTRTPNTDWIININTGFGWSQMDDPCYHLLGSGWRIPTGTEWTNVDASGGWMNWNGPWNSGLKMHAAGDLSNSDGSLLSRGVEGHYWSNSRSTNTHGWTLIFYDSFCVTGIDPMSYGFSIRCIREL
jgi:hypothetical protein